MPRPKVAVGSGATGITINAGANDVIHLRGLTIEGAGVGAIGIQFNTGRSLDVLNCVVRHFTGEGIAFNPGASSKLSVSNTLVADNGVYGIYVQPTGSGTVTGVLDNVESDNNRDGLVFDGNFSTGTVQFTISDSVSANNSRFGIIAVSQTGKASTALMVRASTMANNSGAGLQADGSDGGGAATLRVTRSTITGNATGLLAAFGGTLLSYGDNNVDGNTTNGTPSNTIALH